MILNNQKLIYSVDELKTEGFSYYLINQLVRNNFLQKLNKQHYENLSYENDFNDLFYVKAFASKGIVCLMSAASYYGLTTFRPDCIDVAIERTSSISNLPKWPEIKIHYFTNPRFNKGVIEVNDGLNDFRIYDIEKTVVDIVYYREKIGIEETKEILINYLKRKDRNLNKLVEYANELKCSDILSKYLEVLI